MFNQYRNICVWRTNDNCFKAETDSVPAIEPLTFVKSLVEDPLTQVSSLFALSFFILKFRLVTELLVFYFIFRVERGAPSNPSAHTSDPLVSLFKKSTKSRIKSEV